MSIPTKIVVFDSWYDAYEEPGAVLVRAISDDPSGRWYECELGILLQNDYPGKYDYKVWFAPSQNVPRYVAPEDEVPFLVGLMARDRQYYFYSDEIIWVTGP